MSEAKSGSAVGNRQLAIDNRQSTIDNYNERQAEKVPGAALSGG
jgi:hypothetical protein